MSLLDVLRAREETTIDVLAAELRVSRRTILRDLASLRERGAAIASDVGRGGGVRLERDGGSARVTFADGEIVALWLSAHLAQRGTVLPWSGATRAALAKLFASISRVRQRELRALLDRVVVGNPATARVRESSSQPPPELLGLFERAFTSHKGLAFDYRDREGRSSTRRIEPHGLLVEPPVWYILARDRVNAAPRMFRMDRVSRPRLAPDVEFVPDSAVIDALVPHVVRDR